MGQVRVSLSSTSCGGQESSLRGTQEAGRVVFKTEGLVYVLNPSGKGPAKMRLKKQ